MKIKLIQAKDFKIYDSSGVKIGIISSSNNGSAWTAMSIDSAGNMYGLGSEFSKRSAIKAVKNWHLNSKDWDRAYGKYRR